MSPSPLQSVNFTSSPHTFHFCPFLSACPPPPPSASPVAGPTTTMTTHSSTPRHAASPSRPLVPHANTVRHAGSQSAAEVNHVRLRPLRSRQHPAHHGITALHWDNRQRCMHCHCSIFHHSTLLFSFIIKSIHYYFHLPFIRPNTSPHTSLFPSRSS